MSHAAIAGSGAAAAQPQHSGFVRSRRRREVVVAYILLAPAVLLVMGLQAYPLAWQFWFSLTNYSPVLQTAVFVGLRNYSDLLRDPTFWRGAVNTAGYIVVTGVLKLAVGVAMALVLHRPFPGRPLVYLAAFLPWAYPASVGIIGWYWYMIPPLHSSYAPFMMNLSLAVEGTVGNGAWGFLSLILFNVWRGGSFTAIVLLAALNGVPQELFDYAVLEVRSGWRQFWMVTAPLLRPFLALAAFLSLTSAVVDLSNVWVMTGGRIVYPIVWTQALHYAIVGGQWAKGMALALLPLPILIAILLVCYHFFEPLEDVAG